MKVTKHIVKSSFGDITLVKIENASGASVTLSSLGAGIVKVCVPDKNGKIENVALSYADPADYMNDGPCAGKIPGRYANRIGGASFKLDGTEYTLIKNQGENTLHGGPMGFQNHIWETEELPDGVKFTYHSPDGDEKFPGNLTATAEYRWSDDNTLSLKLKATTDKPTVVNLTNHAYFNLDGADAGSILKHKLKIKGSHYLPTTKDQIPTGEVAPVKDTPMDFTEVKMIGKDINADFEALKIGKGYDHCWVLDTWKKGKLVDEAVVLESDESGRKLTVETTQPGMQIYTGNWLAGSPKNCSGKSYEDYDGVAIEMQGFPDSPNKPEFPSTRLNPGEEYKESIIFHFSVN